MDLGGINVSNSLIISILAVGISLFLIVFFLLVKGRISIKYALVFFIPTIIIGFVGIMPNFIWPLAEGMGFQSIATLILGTMIVILFLFSVSLIVIVSGQRTKLTLLIQEVSILKDRVHILEGKDNEDR